MKRLAWWALPAALAVAGIAFIILGTQAPDGGPTISLPPIAAGSETPVPTDSPTPAAGLPESEEPAPTPVPTPTPLPPDVVAEQLEIPSVGINVLVRQSPDAASDNFPPRDAAYILSTGSQPGQNTNSYIFAHANETLFKPLWNVHLGAEVLIRMSDGSVRRYLVTEVRPNVPCPDANADPALNPPDPPLALQIHENCDAGVFWLQPTPYERITLQTSQGYNRNWGEYVVVAEPAG